MSTGTVVLWTLGILGVIACLVFVGIFVKFVAKAAVSYARHRPYPAMALFGIPGALGSFVTAWFGAPIYIAVLVGLAAGLAVYLLVAMEMGAD